MTDNPKLEPHAFSKRRTAGVPRLESNVPNLRSAPSVNTFAAQSQVDMLVNMADDAKRLEMVKNRQFNLSKELFDQAQAEVENDQRIEAEAILAESEFAIQTAIETARQNSSISDIPEKSMEAYDSVVRATLEKSELSSFQKDMLQQSYDKARIDVAGKTLEYQAQLRKIEQANNIKRTVDAATLKIANDPSLLKEESDKLQGSLSPKAFAKAKRELTEVAVLAGLDKHPSEYAERLRSGEFDEGIDGKTKLKWLDVAETELNKADREYEDIKNETQKEIANAILLQMVQSQDSSIPPEKRPPAPTALQIANSRVSFSQKRTLLNLREDQGVDSLENIKDVQDQIPYDPEAAADLLDNLAATNNVSTGMYLRLDGEINDSKEGLNKQPVLKTELEGITKITKSPTLSTIPNIAQVEQTMKDELGSRVDEFKQTRPEASSAELNQFIRIEANNVKKQFLPEKIIENKFTIGKPYKFSGETNDVSLELIAESEKRVAQDLKNNIISKTRAGREAVRIEGWRELLRIEEGLQEDISGR